MRTKRHMCAFTFCLLLGLSAFAQNPQPAPANTITGDWQGAVGKQHLNLKIETAEAGGLRATLILPDNGNLQLPFDSAVLQSDGRLQLQIQQLNATYTGTPSADGSAIAGTWKQGGSSVALTFRRPGATATFTLKPRTQGTIALQPCRTPDGNIEGLCGTHEVFENRQSRTGRKL